MNKKISDSQKQVLDSLVCERLASDEQNLRLGALTDRTEYEVGGCGIDVNAKDPA